MNYHGAPCPLCGQIFKEGDDVVVCPDCGTPYHRSCYKEKGFCIMDELHESGGEWVNPNKPKPGPNFVNQQTIAACPDCGHPNHVDNLRCENCGKHLTPAAPSRSDSPYERRYEEDMRVMEEDVDHGQPMAEIFGRIDPNSHIQKIAVRDIIAFTQNNASYFVRLFKLMSMEVSASVFNWSALLFGPFYFLYRKMYHKGITLLLLELATYLPSFAVAYHLMPQVISDPSLLQTMAFDTSGLGFLMTISNIAGYIPWVLHIYAGFTANKTYFNHSMSSLQQLSLQFAGNRAEMEKQILRRGGVNPVAVFLGILAVAALFLLVSAFITLMLLPMMS